MKVFSLDFLNSLSDIEKGFYLFLIKNIVENQSEETFYEVRISKLPENLKVVFEDKSVLIKVVSSLRYIDVKWRVDEKGREVIYDASLIGSWQISTESEGGLSLRYSVPELLLTALFEEQCSEKLQTLLRSIYSKE